MLIFYADSADPDAQIFRAEQYEKGTAAFCPYCGARMHLSHSPLGTPFMALYMGEVHTSRFCKKMEASETQISLEKTSLHKLIVDLLRSPKNYGWNRRNFRGNGRNVWETRRNYNINDRDERKNLSLQDLADLQIHRFGADYLLGGLPLSHEMLSYRWARDISNIFENYVGPKIIHALFDDINLKYQDVWFTVFFSDHDSNRVFLPFKLHFYKLDYFDSFLEKYCSAITADDGTTQYIEKNPNAEYYIAANWDDWTGKSGKRYLSGVCKNLRQVACLER